MEEFLQALAQFFQSHPPIFHDTGCGWSQRAAAAEAGIAGRDWLNRWLSGRHGGPTQDQLTALVRWLSRAESAHKKFLLQSAKLQ